jgi:hypothetical protein
LLEPSIFFLASAIGVWRSQRFRGFDRSPFDEEAAAGVQSDHLFRLVSLKFIY